jgi:hypothetical protein
VEKRQHEAGLTGFYSQLRNWARENDLTLEEQDVFIRRYIDDNLEDPADRKFALSLHKIDHDSGMTARASADRQISDDYLKDIEGKDLLPSVVAAGVDNLPLSSAANEELKKRILEQRAHVVTPQNSTALRELERRIDLRHVVSDPQIEAFAQKHEMTSDQLKYAKDRRNRIDKDGFIHRAIVERAYRELRQGTSWPVDLPDDIYHMVQDRLLNEFAGGSPTNDAVKKMLGELFIRGSAPGSGWFGLEKPEELHGAIREGRSPHWLPILSKEQLNEASVALRAKDLQPKEITGLAKRIYWREEVMGLPPWEGKR